MDSSGERGGRRSSAPTRRVVRLGDELAKPFRPKLRTRAGTSRPGGATVWRPACQPAAGRQLASRVARAGPLQCLTRRRRRAPRTRRPPTPPRPPLTTTTTAPTNPRRLATHVRMMALHPTRQHAPAARESHQPYFTRGVSLHELLLHIYIYKYYPMNSYRSIYKVKQY